MASQTGDPTAACVSQGTALLGTGHVQLGCHSGDDVLVPAP